MKKLLLIAGLLSGCGTPPEPWDGDYGHHGEVITTQQIHYKDESGKVVIHEDFLNKHFLRMMECVENELSTYVPNVGGMKVVIVDHLVRPDNRVGEYNTSDDEIIIGLNGTEGYDNLYIYKIYRHELVHRHAFMATGDPDNHHYLKSYDGC